MSIGQRGFDRRDFMKLATAGALGAMASSLSKGAPSATRIPTDKPNVILIMADDLGSADLGIYGSDDLNTPRLDALAKSGTRFSQFYSMAAVCTPARGALLTGRYPLRNGATNNSRSMHADEITIAAALREAGYRTANIGKWHLGEQTGPLKYGFDEFFGHLRGCIHNYDHCYYNWNTGTDPSHDLWRNETEVFEDGTHFGELLVRESTRFIKENRERPFFIYLAFNNPHYPLQPLPQFLKNYKHLPEQRRSYAAFVETMDYQLGRIFDAVDGAGLRENTIIVFESDNGASDEERNRLWLDEPNNEVYRGGSSGPYRGGKFQVWEGGIRLPAMISWPGCVPKNAVRDQMVCSMDWFPTLLGYCGVDVPTDRVIDGKDIAKVIASKKAPSPHKALAFQWGRESNWAWREGSWKLLKQDGEIFLSNIEEDVREKHNCIDRFPEIADRLDKARIAWRKTLPAPVPKPKKKKATKAKGK